MHGLLFYHQLPGTGRQVSFPSFPFSIFLAPRVGEGKEALLEREAVHAHVGRVLPLLAPLRKPSPPCSTVDRAQGRGGSM